MVWAPHVTVACVAECEGRFLLVEEEADGHLVYNQPAGHLEPGESLIEAVTRETREESGLSFAPTHLVGVYRWSPPESARTYLRFCFAGSTTTAEPDRPLDPEIRRVLWLTRSEVNTLLPHLRSPLVLRCIDDYLRGSRHSLELLCDVG